ncbi:MAG: hypothetical protein PHQ75_08390, partial [Thermoguttaceae bacterium]|nr:hypothetical protein [Thermoguttaceae bacterium]
MTNRQSTLLFALLFVLSATFVFAQEQTKIPGKKLIELGWDIPNTRFMKSHWQEMEKTTPFDGIMFEVVPDNSD